MLGGALVEVGEGSEEFSIEVGVGFWGLGGIPTSNTSLKGCRSTRRGGMGVGFFVLCDTLTMFELDFFQLC